MEGYQDTIPLYEKALESAGTTQSKYNQYLEGTQAHIDRLRTAMTSVFSSTFNSEGLRNIIDLLTNLTIGLNKLIESFGFIPTLSTIVGTSFIALSTKARTAAISFLGLDKAIQGATLSLRILKGTLASLGIGAIIFGVSLAIDALTSTLAKNAEKQKEIKRTNDQAVESWSKNKSEIQSLVAEYETLSKKTSLSSEEQERLTEVQNKLNQLMPIFTDHIDEQGNAHLRASEAIAKEIKYVQELKESYDKLTLAKFDKEVKELFNDIDDKLKEINKLKNKTGEVIVSPSAPGGVSLPVFIPESEEDAILRQREVIQNERELAVLYDQIADLVNKKVDAYLSVESATKNLTETDKEYLKTQTDLFKETITSKDELLSFSNSLTNVAVNISKVKNALNAGTYSGLVQTSSDLQKSLMEIGYSADEASKEVEKLIKQFSSSEMEQGKDNVFDLAKYQSELKESLSNYSDSVKDLASAYATLNNGEELSLDTIIGLIDKYPELITHLVNENGQLKLNKDAILLLAKAKEEEFKNSLRIKEQELQAEANALTQKLSLYGLEIKSLQDVAKARQEALKALGEYAGMGVGTQLFSDIDKIEEYYKTIEGYRALINSDLTKNLSGRSKSSSSKDNPQLKELEDSTDAFIRLQNAAANANKELANRIKDQIEMAKNQENYNDAISKTNDLLKTQRQIVDDLKYANQNINAQADKLRKNNSQYDTSKWFDRNAEATIAYYNQLNSLIEKRNRIEQSVKDKDSRAKQVEAIDKEINSIKQLFDQLQKLKRAYMDNVVSIHEMNSAIRETNSSLSQLQYDQIIYTLDYYADKMEEVDRLMSISQASMEQYNETSSEYAKEMANLSSLLAYKKSLIKDEIDLIKEQLTSNDLLISQQEELKKRLQELELAYLQLNKQQEENVKKVADNLINVYKDALKKQMDLLVATKNKEIKLEDERHKRVMDNLDDELKKYEEIIQAKLRSLEDQWSEEDFNKELAKMQSEAQATQNRINELSLDDSVEARVQREELERQLQEKLLEIENFKTKRSRDLRKQALQDQLDNFKKEIDAKKKAEDEQYNATKARLEKEREDIQWHYNELLNNEREFERLRTDIINGHVDEIQNKLTAFITEFKKVNEQAAYDIGESYQELLNIIDRVNSATGAMSSIPSSTPSVPSQNNLKAQAWEEYLENKRKAEQLYKEKGYWDTALNVRNNELRQQWGFPDGSYEKLKNLKMYHQGGIVGDNGSPVAKWINRMFNLKPNEEIIKVLKGEVVVNPMKFERLMPKLTLPKITSPVANSTSSPTVIHIDKFMPIDKVDRNTDVRKLFNDAENELKNWGIIIPTSS